jgi:hypothetical protein
MNTIPGMSFQPACKLVRAMTPQMIQTTPSKSRYPGSEGRLPTCPGPGGGPGGLRRWATEGMLQRRVRRGRED